MKSAASWLICYDIADPRRLGRVHRVVSEFAVPVQYSVFWARLGRVALNDALRVVATRIDPRADDVRFYPLPETVQAFRLGRQVLPAGVYVQEQGLERLLRDGA